MESRPYAVVPFEKGSTAYRVKRYRERAQTLREIAADVVARECQEMLIRLANTYEEMAAEEASIRH